MPAALKIRIINRQATGPFRNMNRGETAVHPMADLADFSALGIKKASDPAYRTLMKTGEVNGIRVLEMDAGNGDGWQQFGPAQRAEAASSADKAREADQEAKREAAERAAAAQKVVEAEERKRLKEEAERLEAEAAEAKRVELEEAKRLAEADRAARKAAR